MNRRDFIVTVGAAASVGAVHGLAGCEGRDPASASASGKWEGVRARFELDPAWIHLAGMLLAPHPDTVRRAIARHREAFDRNPTHHLAEESTERQNASREAAARYMGVQAQDIALTDSTTMGIGLIYTGVRIRPDQAFLTTEHDYHATHDALEFRRLSTGADVHRIELFDDPREASRDSIVDAMLDAITDDTRVIAATWVHSSTGFKLPVSAIAEGLEGVNRDRAPDDRALLCLDGVHGLGIEDDDIGGLGCDFFFAGTHKWIFAPRGTGVLWGRPEVQEQVGPTIPTFTRDRTWGGTMTPGGFKAFEHQWAMAQAFEFMDEAGSKAEVRERIHSLARQLKEGLEGMAGVTLHTPMSPDLSSGVVCFDVDGLSPTEVVAGLEDRGVIASVTPYDPSHARFSPGLVNTPEEMDRTLAAVRDLV